MWRVEEVPRRTNHVKLDLSGVREHAVEVNSLLHRMVLHPAPVFGAERRSVLRDKELIGCGRRRAKLEKRFQVIKAEIILQSKVDPEILSSIFDPMRVWIARQMAGGQGHIDRMQKALKDATPGHRLR